MTLVLLLMLQGRTSGGHGLLEALPRIYQVTPDIPDRRRATKHKEVRPQPGRQPQRQSARRPVGTITTTSDVTDEPDPNSKPHCDSDDRRARADREIVCGDVVPMHRMGRVGPGGASVVEAPGKSAGSPAIARGGEARAPALRAKRVACAACRDARSRLESRTSESRLCRGECRTWRDLESRPCSSSEGSKRPSAEMRAFTRIWAWRFRLLVVRCRGRHHRRCARGAGWQGVRRLRGAPAPSGWRGRTNSR